MVYGDEKKKACSGMPVPSHAFRSLVRGIAATLTLVFVTACQTTSGGLPRDKWVDLPKDLLRLQVDGEFFTQEVDAVGIEAEAAWLTAKGNQKYFERLTFSGPGYVGSLHLRMLPDGWYWTVQESAFGLQNDLETFYDRVLGSDFQVGSIATVRTGFPRSFYAKFTSKGRECAGILAASNVGGVSGDFRNIVVGYICASRGSASSLSDVTVEALLNAMSLEDPYYNGNGFSDEQVEYFKANNLGAVSRIAAPLQGAS